MSNTTITLPNELTIAQVEVFKVEVIDMINNAESFSIDDSNIIRIDTAGVQLIIAIITYVLSLNKSLDWQCTAQCISESIKKLGINETILTNYI